MSRRLTTPQLAVDIGIALLCILLRGITPLDPLLWAVVLFMAAALAVRRLSPALALALAWAGAVLQMGALLPPDIANVAILPVLFATARYGGRALRWLGLASVVVGALLASGYFVFWPGFVGRQPDDDTLAAVFVFILVGGIATLGLSWTMGLLLRVWDNARQSRREQLAAQREAIIEQERNRIARDMHDVVAHSLAVVIAQADGARYAGDREATDAALSAISSSAREALGDVRLLLGQLRHRQEEGPQPVLADLDRLLDQVRSSGLTVDLERAGTPLPMGASGELALYRIAQEALTNALRHGDTAAPVAALLSWEADAASLTVSNAVRRSGHAEAHEGHGLAGMRERALLVGGSLDAGRAEDSWVVRARIPVSP